MASIDLKDAYYGVPMAVESQKYLKFICQDQLLVYTCYPNGLCICPRQFKKLMKPVLSVLHCQGRACDQWIYIDDLLIMHDSFKDSAKAVVDTTCLFDSLWFVVYPEKSACMPSQQLVFLGFLIHFVDMKVCLVKDRILNIERSIQFALDHPENLTLQFVAKIIALLVASFPPVQFGPLHYRYIELDKIQALKLTKGNFEASMKLSAKTQHDLL